MELPRLPRPPAVPAWLARLPPSALKRLSSLPPSSLPRLASLLARVSRVLSYFFVPDLMVTVFFRHATALVVVWAGYTAWRRLLRRPAVDLLRAVRARVGPTDGGRMGRLVELQARARAARTYEEWRAAAEETDALEGRLAWRDDPYSPHYDQGRVSADLLDLRVLVDEAAADVEAARAGAAAEVTPQAGRAPVRKLMHFLRARLLRNLAGTGHPDLYARMRTGTKRLIEEYRAEVVRALQLVCAAPARGRAGVPAAERLAFFNETRHSYGRTALMLSGGATIGMYHAGVIKALFDRNLLPRIISGASVGSIIAGIVATRTDDEMEGAFERVQLNFFPDNRNSVRRKLRRLATEGVLMDITILRNCVRANIPDVTFKEAYERTGRIVNIVVSPTSGNRDSARLLNYLTAPHVLVWSACLASCAIPGVYAPVQLLCKDDDGLIAPYLQEGVEWSDGSVHADLPMRRLAELFNVNHFVVSQTNPHVLPFLSGGASDRGGAVVRVLDFLVRELKGWLLNLGTLGFFPESMDVLRFLLDQRYTAGKTGITIAPRVTVADYRNLLRNPTPERLEQCTRHTERETWKKMDMIAAHCEVEFTLDECVRRLRGEMILDAGAAAAAAAATAGGDVYSGAAGGAAGALKHTRSWSAESFRVAHHAEGDAAAGAGAAAAAAAEARDAAPDADAAGTGAATATTESGSSSSSGADESDSKARARSRRRMRSRAAARRGGAGRDAGKVLSPLKPPLAPPHRRAASDEGPPAFVMEPSHPRDDVVPASGPGAFFPAGSDARLAAAALPGALAPAPPYRRTMPRTLSETDLLSTHSGGSGAE